MILTRKSDEPPQVEYGTRPVLAEKDALCPDCGQVHDIEACPDCGADIVLGFGLMFGSYGEYRFCEDECGWFWRRPDWDALGVEAETEEEGDG